MSDLPHVMDEVQSADAHRIVESQRRSNPWRALGPALALLLVAVSLDAFRKRLIADHVVDVTWYEGLLFFALALSAAWLVLEVILALVSASARTRAVLRVMSASTLISLAAAESVLRQAQVYATYTEKTQGRYISLYSWQERSWNYVYSHDTHYVTPEFTYDRKLNSEGLTDVEWPIEKAATELRIAGLGDSFTEGVGVSMDDSWPRQMERNLAQELGSSRVRVLNAGKSNSDPFFEFMLFERHVASYRPDIVVIVLNSTDIGDVVVRGGSERFLEDGRVSFSKSPAWEWLYSVCYLVRPIFRDVLGFRGNLIRSRDLGARNASAACALLALLEERRSELAARGMELVIVFCPLVRETQQGRYGTMGVLVDSAVEQLDAFDLLDFYLGRGLGGEIASSYYWALDEHHNAAGYALMAEGIELALRSRGLLNP